MQDLDDIWEYIATETENPMLAQVIINKILSAIEKLQAFARMGTVLSKKVPFPNNYRFLVVDNYMIFYRYEFSDIYVGRILFGSRNYLRILFEEKSQ